MAQASQLPAGLTEDERQWIHWRMEWLCTEFSDALLQNAKVALPTSNHFPQLFSGHQGNRNQGKKVAADYLKRIAQWMDFDSSNIGLSFEGDPEDSSEAEGYQISVKDAELEDRPALLGLLAHEIGYLQLTEFRQLADETEDLEGLADLTAVFLGMGVVLANTSQQQQADDVEAFQAYLSPPMLGYALALFADMRGETQPVWANELRTDVLEAFYDAQYYLENSDAEEPKVSEEELTELEPVQSEDLGTPDLENRADTGERHAVTTGAEIESKSHGAESKPSAEAATSTRRYSNSRKCTQCGRLTEINESLCEFCQRSVIDHREALREELSKHDESIWLVHFGLLIAIVTLILIVVAAINNGFQ